MLVLEIIIFKILEVNGLGHQQDGFRLDASLSNKTKALYGILAVVDPATKTLVISINRNSVMNNATDQNDIKIEAVQDITCVALHG